MAEPKRPDPKRRPAASRPSAAGRSGGDASRGRPRKPSDARREPRTADTRPRPEVLHKTPEGTAQAPAHPSIAANITESAEHRSEQRLGFTARRAAILAAVVCVLTLTIAGPVRTYFAQRTEMNQLAATEASLRAQIADLEEQKTKLADPVFIAAQARERLGFVMPGDIPYQVQLPPTAEIPAVPGAQSPTAKSTDPWYTSLWKTISDAPHGAPTTVPDMPPAEPPPPTPAAPGG